MAATNIYHLNADRGMDLLKLIHINYTKEDPTTPPFDNEWIRSYLEALIIADYESLTNSPSPFTHDIVRSGV